MDIQQDGDGDKSDPMEKLIVSRGENLEQYTRYRLQETLMLMGCRPKDAMDIVSGVFETFYQYSQKQKPSSGKEAIPWPHLHQCIYAELAKLEYTKLHHLLDFQVAKEITQRNQSFVVLLGGTSGTGKSTLASLLAARLRLTTVLPTDSVRHISRAFITKEEHPCAFMSTYQAGEALNQAQIDELRIASDGVMSENRLQKRKVLKGYKLQSDTVLEKLDQVLTMFEKRNQSIVVEGVHLNTDQMLELVRKHPNCVPFVIYISNELKHRERFAVRARHMTIDPQENKYIKYFDNIRIIQRHLCKNAEKFLIPKIDNTNVDRSLATIQSTLIRVLRKLAKGEKMIDEKIGKFVLLSREHESAIKKAWSSKGVRKAMRPLINQKVSKRLLLRRLLAEQSSSLYGRSDATHDSSSSDENEDGHHHRQKLVTKNEHGEYIDDEDDDDEQTTVIGSLFSATENTRPKPLSQFPLQEMAEKDILRSPHACSDDMTFSDVISDLRLMTHDLKINLVKKERLKNMNSRFSRRHSLRDGNEQEDDDTDNRNDEHDFNDIGKYSNEYTLQLLSRNNNKLFKNRKKHMKRPVSSSPKKSRQHSQFHQQLQIGKMKHFFDDASSDILANCTGHGREDDQVNTSADFDIDSVSVADMNRDDVSDSSSHAANCTSPLAQSMDGMDCRFEISSQSSDD